MNEPIKCVTIPHGHHWSQSARLILIYELDSELMRRIRAGTASPAMILDALERIGLLASYSASFLQDNREAILNGQPLTPPSSTESPKE